MPESAKPNSPCADLPPELAHHPKYRIVRELGRGGMGVGYQARQTGMMDRQVVIKVINRSLIDNPEVLARFRREVKAASQLSHPNIVTAYDAEQAGELHLLVMEFVPGRNLADVLAARGPLPLASACRYVRQAARALQHAYDRGMVHRDIKPENLMLTPEGQIKVLDFGIAKVVSEQNAGTGLTASNSYVGTPEYSAPEQITDARSADIRADLYSLGCTLYCLLAGRPPFQEATAMKTLLAHLQKEPPPLSQQRPDVPEGLWRVVVRLLAKEPGQRYQKPNEVVQALGPFVKGAPKPLSQPPPLPKREQSNVAPPVARETLGEGSFPTAKGSSKPLPFSPSPPKGRQRPIGPQAMPETVSEDEVTLAGSSRKANIKWSRKWIIVPLMIVLSVGLLGLWAILGSRPTTTKASLSKEAGNTDVTAKSPEQTAQDNKAKQPGNPQIPTKPPERRTQVSESAQADVVDEKAEAKAIQTVERLGGRVTRDLKAKGRPVREVDLSGTKVTDASLIDLLGCKHLKSINLASCVGVTDDGIRALGECKQLQKVWLCRCDFKATAVKELASLPELQELDVRDCRQVTDAEMRHLAACQNLTTLGLEGCWDVTASGIKELGACKKLHTLRLGISRGVTDAAMKELPKIKQLQYLHLSGPLITDAGLGELASCDQLSSLSLWPSELKGANGEQLTPRCLKRLVACKQLKELELSFNATDEWLKEFAACVQVRRLTLKYCDKVTAAGLKNLTVCKQLEKLLVIGRTQATDPELADLKRALPTLEILDH